MTWRLDQPEWLWLLLLAAPMALLGYAVLRRGRGMDRLRLAVTLALRTLLLAAIALMLAGPQLLRTRDQLAVLGVIDVSRSVQRFAHFPAGEDLSQPSAVAALRDWFREATRTRQGDDRFGLIVFDGRATVISPPVRGPYVDDHLDVTTIDGTNIEEAIRLALAMLPADAARRIVLVSDGNETIGDAVEAAAQASGASVVNADAAAQQHFRGIPIDVAAIDYHVTNDSQVVRIEAPATARHGQTVTVRIVMESAHAVDGRLSLRLEGATIDLNGSAPGTSRPVHLPQGTSIHSASVTLGRTPVHRFEAVFEPLVPDADQLPDNNRALTMIATPMRGSMLVLEGRGEADPLKNPIVLALREAQLEVEVQRPSALPDDPFSLQAHDLIVLDNVAAFDLTPQQHELLAGFVNDMGGGLIMVGGMDSFGAGGWNNTALEAVLPLELDPPRELRLPSAALVLVLDKSGSMNHPVAGARASQQEVANNGAALAVESLRAESYIGVVAFDSIPREVVPIQRNDEPAKIAAMIRSISAEGGTSIKPALNAAWTMMSQVKVQRKRVVLLTDGRSPNDGLGELAARMAEDGIAITTIGVGDDIDAAMLQHIAEVSGGEFLEVRNPGMLPRVLIDSVQVLNKPLIKEGEFQPQLRPGGSPMLATLAGAPPLQGLVMTSPKPDSQVTIDAVHPDGEPLLAHWQAGLGKVAAFTSDAHGLWSKDWLAWPGFEPFWAQLARLTARSESNQSFVLSTSIEDDRLKLLLEPAGDTSESMNDLTVEGHVYQPDGSKLPVRLRQSGPGRYEGASPAAATGTYVVALSPRKGAQVMAPVIGGVSQTSSAEFRRYDSNLALLEEIVDRSGGRRLDLMNPVAVNLFDRTGMPPSVTLTPLWRHLLWAALLLLLLDVACRRIAWDSLILSRSLRRAAALQKADARGEQARATLATLRQVNTQMESRIESQAAGIERPAPQSELQLPRYRPGREEVERALDELAGRAAKKEIGAKPQAAQGLTRAESEGPSPSTEGLLAAKRRARERFKQNENPPK